MSTSPTTGTLYLYNDNVIEVTGLRDSNAATGVYLNAATVTATIKTRSGTAVTGVTFPVTLDYVTDSNGDYRGTVDAALVLVEGGVYWVEVTIVSSTLNGHLRKQVVALYREV